MIEMIQVNMNQLPETVFREKQIDAGKYNILFKALQSAYGSVSLLLSYELYFQHVSLQNTGHVKVRRSLSKVNI